MSGVQQVDDLPRLVEVDGHHAAAPFYLTAEMFGGLPVDMAGAELSDLVERPIASPHSHQVAEVYVLLSPEPGGAELEVTVDDEVFQMVAPSALYVPAGARHRFVTKKADRGSYCLGLLLQQPKPESIRSTGEEEG
jgi:hypothetical protein